MGRSLSIEEESLRQRRLRELPGFLEDRVQVLIDFATRLNLPEPESIVSDPLRHLAALSAFMEDQVVAEDDRIWILTRIGYFVGELLARRFRGRWFLNEIPDSRYFLHYVVGKFEHLKNPHAMAAPFEVADYFVSLPPRRDLSALVHEVESALVVA